MELEGGLQQAGEIHAAVHGQEADGRGPRDELDAGEEEEGDGERAGQEDGAHRNLAPVAPRVELCVCVGGKGDV